MKPKRHTIGYFDDGVLRSGTGRYLAEIIGGLDRDRFQPVFFAPVPRAWHDDFVRMDVELVYPEGVEPLNTAEATPTKPAEQPLTRRRRIRLPKTAAWFAGLTRDTARLRKLFQRRHVDLLHTNNTGAEPAPIAARLAEIPLVLGTFHVLPSYDVDNLYSGWNFRLLERRSMASLHRAIACCAAAKNEWHARCGFTENLATVVYNGIEPERVERRQSAESARKHLGLPTDATLIVGLGNLHRLKGFEYLVRALPEVLKQNPKVRLAIGGTGPLAESLCRLGNELGVADAIYWLGFCNDVRALLESADVYAHPSIIEAFPMSLLEAGGAGLPTVATNVGGIPELVQDGVTGMLVPPHNPEAIAQALCKMLASPEQLAEMGRAAQDRVLTHFTRAKMVEQTVAIYNEMLEAA